MAPPPGVYILSGTCHNEGDGESEREKKVYGGRKFSLPALVLLYGDTLPEISS